LLCLQLKAQVRERDSQLEQLNRELEEAHHESERNQQVGSRC
jgi:hypothetical protein